MKETPRRATEPGVLPASLRRSAESGRLAPSVLLEGPDSVRLREAALELAAILLCKKRGCGTCRACRLARAGTHPDLHVLGKDKPTVISVDAIAPVLEDAHRTPIEGERQVFLIDPADALEPAGTARYLKSLEEPPMGTVFLLLTTHPESLPETVLSRCRRVRFPPETAERIAARLVAEGADAAEAARLARWAGGSTVRAMRLRRTDVPAVLAAVVDAARDAKPRVAEAADRAVKALDAAAGEEMPDVDDEGKVEWKRETLRALLQDLTHALSVEAREVAAGRPSDLLGPLGDDAGMVLLGRCGTLSAAIASNVTPAAVVIDLISALRAALRPSRDVRSP